MKHTDLGGLSGGELIHDDGKQIYRYKKLRKIKGLLS